MANKKEVIVIGCYPNSSDKIDVLKRNVHILKKHSKLPVAVVSHYPIPDALQEEIDYFLYDKNNLLAEESDFPIYYWFGTGEILITSVFPFGNYHASSILSNIKNALHFFKFDYDIIHYVEMDTFFYINKYLDMCERYFQEGKKFVGFEMFEEGKGEISLKTIYGCLMSFDISWMLKNFPDGDTWDKYKSIYYLMKDGEKDYLKEHENLFFESWFYRYFEFYNLLNEVVLLTEQENYIIIDNIYSNGDIERFLLSETDRNELMLFVLREKRKKQSCLSKKYKIVNKLTSKILYEGDISVGTVIWYIIEKKNIILDCFINDILKDTMVVDKDHTYNDTVFYFNNNYIKCISWYGDPGKNIYNFELNYSNRKKNKEGTLYLNKSSINVNEKDYYIYYSYKDNRLHFENKSKMIGEKKVIIKDISNNIIMHIFYWDLSYSFWASPSFFVDNYASLDGFNGFLIEIFDKNNQFVCKKEVTVKKCVPVDNFKFCHNNEEQLWINIYEMFYKDVYREVSFEDIKVVVDIGANIGIFTRYCLKKGIDKCYSIDPSSSYQYLKENFKNDSKVECIEAAISGKTGVYNFYNPVDKGSVGSLFLGDNDINVVTTEVNVYSFNDFVEKYNIKKIDLLKIDTEGAEYDIVEFMDDEYLNKNISQLIIEFHFNKGNVINILNKLNDNGFNYKIYKQSSYDEGSDKDENGIIIAKKNNIDVFKARMEGYNDLNTMKIFFNIINNNTYGRYKAYIIDIPTNLLIYCDEFNIIDNTEFWMSIDSHNVNNVKFLIQDSYNNIIFEKDFKTEKEINRLIDHNLFSDFNDVSFGIYESIFFNKEYENDFCKIENGDICVDIGANNGFFSVYAVIKGASKVYSIEPCGCCFEQLLKNKSFCEKYDEAIIPFKCAISTLTGEKDLFTCSEASCMNSLFDKKRACMIGRETVQVIDINEFIRINNIKHINFLKIDAELSEYGIIDKIDNNFLESCVDKMAIEFHDVKNYNYQGSLSKIQESGFEYFEKIYNDDDLILLYAWKNCVEDITQVQEEDNLNMLEYSDFDYDKDIKMKENKEKSQNSYDEDLVFITGGNEKYMPLIEILVESLLEFSNHKIIVYGYNCEIPFNYSNMIKKRIDLPYNDNLMFDGNRYISVMFAKIDCLIDVINTEKYENYVWIDGDSFVSKNIDNIIQYKNIIENYPLINSHLFDSIIIHTGRNNVVVGEAMAQYMGVSRNGVFPWVHANVIFFTQKCVWFFEEILEIKEKMLEENKVEFLEQMADESIINILFWKYKFRKTMKIHDYDTYYLEFFDKFFEEDWKSGYVYAGDNFSEMAVFPSSRDEVYVFHSQKDPILAKNMLNKYRKFLLEEGNKSEIIYVTGANDIYMTVAEQCVKGINEFSSHQIIVYGFDCDVPFNYPCMIKRRIDLTELDTSSLYNNDKRFLVARTLCNLDCIKEKKNNIYIWIDADIIPTENIDKITDFVDNLGDHPRFSRYRFEDMSYWKIFEDNGKKIIKRYGEEFYQILGEEYNRKNFISAGGIYAYSNKSKTFFEKVNEIRKKILDNFILINDNTKSALVDNNALSDEKIYNYLIWKNNYEDFIPITWFSGRDSFIGEYPSMLTPFVEEDYSPMYIYNKKNNFSISLPCNYETIIAFHDDNVYSKSEEKALKAINRCIKRHKMKQKINKLMIVSHPDDESIFGGDALLTENGWKVICITCGDNEIRHKEFVKAMEYAEVCEYEIWNFLPGYNSNYEDVPLLEKKITEAIRQRNYIKIVTHNPSGEYGNLQHKILSKLLCKISPDNLYMFSIGESLSNERMNKKIELLRIYQSQVAYREKGVPWLPGFDEYVYKEDIVPYKKHYDIVENSCIEKGLNISCHFVGSPFLEIIGDNQNRYNVEFIDSKNDDIIYNTVINSNNWTKVNRKWYTEWIINVYNDEKLIFNHNFNLNNRRVLISCDSKSLGDTLAWVPYIEEFRRKNQCKVFCSTFWNSLFEKEYPKICFVKPGTTVPEIYASYTIGWYFPWDLNLNPIDFRTIPLQKTASDILGLEYKEIKPRITIPSLKRDIQEKYVCIGIHSTAQCKYWNYSNGWQEIVNYLKDKGYKVVLISKEQGSYMGNVPPTGVIDKTGDYSIESRIIDLKYSDMFIGVGSGLSWLAWAIGTPVVLVSGFSNPFCEFSIGDQRIHNPLVCNGCFNDKSFYFDRGDWYWCPRNKDFECTKNISPEMVKTGINSILEEKNVLIEIETDNMEEILYCINCLLIFKNKHKCNIICLTSYGELLGSYGTFEDIEFHNIEGYEKEEKRVYAYYKIEKFMNKKQIEERLGII